MQRRRAAVSTWGTIGLALALAACSSEPLAEDEPPPPTVSAEDYPGRLAETLCQATAACCGARAVEFDTEACVRDVTDFYWSQVNSTRTLDVTFDEAAAARCISSLRTAYATCRWIGSEQFSPPCDAVFVGRVAAGGVCVDALECDPGRTGAFCDPVTNGRGTCTPLVAEGGVCLGPGCAAGLYCDLFTATCQPQVTSGECAIVTACADDFACSPDAECVPKLADGAPCQLDFQCEGGLCDVTGTCARTLASDLVCLEGLL